MTSHIYINGEFLPENAKHVSARDRGFRLGDGVFETIGIKAGQACWLKRHLVRLEHGMKLLKLPPVVENFAAVIADLIGRNNIKDGIARIAVSRGEGSSGYLPASSAATVVVEVYDYSHDETRAVDLWLSKWRRVPLQCLPASCKTAQGLGSTLARMEAAENNCGEALLLSYEGYLSEAASANLFWWRDGKLFTPALTTSALPGVVRSLVMEISPWPVSEVEVELAVLHGAEAVFITNSSNLAVPVASLKPQGWIFNASADIAKQINILLDTACNAA